MKACFECLSGAKRVGVEGGQGVRGSGSRRRDGWWASDGAGKVKEDCHRNDVRDKAIIP